ncbi:MAG: TIGR00341 family protein [Pseudomonadota bacterium]
MRRLDIHMRHNDAFDTVIRIVRAAEPVDYYVVQPEQQDRKLVHVFLRDESGQSMMDNLQTALESETDWRISLLPIEATAPSLKESVKTETKTGKGSQALREEIYSDVVAGATLNRDFLILVALSTIVAAAGMNADSAAGVIGAMVIAPLLGPILGFALGAALGDRELLFGSGWTLLAGVAVAFAASIVIGFVLEIDLQSRELVSRAEVRLDGMALAIAAGSAAAMSMARGQGAVLVGVMVAAALLPPGAAVGMFLGAGEPELAGRAALLLALNVASLVFAALVVFRLRKIQPRGWLKRKDAKRAVTINIVLSLAVLAVCIALIIVLDLGQRISLG